MKVTQAGSNLVWSALMWAAVAEERTK